jgi:signal transduction histidine kinase
MRVSGLHGTIFAWRNQVRKWSYSWMRKWLNGLMDGWLDRWTDGRMNGQMAGWRDWWIYVRMETCIHANILWFHFSLQHLYETYIAPMNSQPFAVELHTAINVRLYVQCASFSCYFNQTGMCWKILVRLPNIICVWNPVQQFWYCRKSSRGATPK